MMLVRKENRYRDGKLLTMTYHRGTYTCELFTYDANLKEKVVDDSTTTTTRKHANDWMDARMR